MNVTIFLFFPDGTSRYVGNHSEFPFNVGDYLTWGAKSFVVTSRKIWISDPAHDPTFCHIGSVELHLTEQ